MHGTHVAGTIGSNGVLKGVAPGVQLNDYRIFDKNGSTSFGAIDKAITMAADDECDVINMSLHAPPTKSLVTNSLFTNNKHTGKSSELRC
jgi:subtilisin family serine protease